MFQHPHRGRPRVARAALALGLIALTAGGARAQSPAAPESLTLAQALERAAAHPAVAAAEARLAAERAVLPFVPGRLLAPELEAELARGGDTFASDEHGEIGVGVSQRIPLGARRRHAADAQRARIAAAEAALAEARRDVARAVREAWHRAAFEQRRLTRLDALADLDRELVEAIRGRVRDETVTPLSGRLTELDWLEVESRRLAARGRAERAGTALAVAIGRTPAAPVAAAGFEADAPDSLVEPDRVVALARRSARVRLERERDLAMAEARAAAAAVRPDLTLGLGLSWEHAVTGGDAFSGDPAVIAGIDGFESNDRIWRVRASLPLAAEPEAVAERARAGAAVAVAEAELRRADLDADAAALEAWSRAREAARRHALFVGPARRIPADLALVRDAWRDGRISLETYLADKGRLTASLIEALDAEQEWWESRAALERALDLDLDSTGGTR